MITVGEKIKSLRKELKMTQTYLAGEELTKSMLSQIENNQSNPSLKTLKYIADRLNRPITYFLEETSDHKNHSLDSDAEAAKLGEQIRRINEFIEADHLIEAQKEIECLLTGSLQNSISKSAADIILKLGIALFKENNPEKAQKYLKHSIEIYIKGAFLLEASKAYVVLAKTYYQKFNYSECLAIADKVFALYSKSISKDPLFEIELYYNKIIVLFALGDLKQTADVIQAALALSEKTSVYYKTDDIYRLNAVFHFLMNSKEAYEQNIEKALQFADLTNDNDCLARIYAMKGIAAVES
ncbi:MAG: helix-turn-helix domain-containing protein, partial [Ruminiclostridium sp.]